MLKDISILVVDDHPIYREGLLKMLSSIKSVIFCDEAENGQVALEKLGQKHYDVVILDIAMEVMNGLEAARRIKESYKDTWIIISSSTGDTGQIVELLELGVDAYILKSADKNEIIKALDYISLGGIYHTPKVYEIWKNYKENIAIWHTFEGDRPVFSRREMDVLKLLYAGKTAKEIGEQLFISYNTVCTHKAHIMKKIGVRRISGLIKYVKENNIFLT
jgi:DNA-binding NarL/FixJ family response regulator